MVTLSQPRWVTKGGQAQDIVEFKSALEALKREERPGIPKMELPAIRIATKEVEEKLYSAVLRQRNDDVMP